MGASPKAMAARLRLSPETIAGLLGHCADPVGGLRATLPEEFLPWYDSAVAEVTAKANERIRLYESLAREAAIDAAPLRRVGATTPIVAAFAVAAQRLAAGSDVHPGPIFALRKGREDARLAIWGHTKPSGHGDPATVSAAPTIG